jgi:hypothetical protein
MKKLLTLLLLLLTCNSIYSQENNQSNEKITHYIVIVGTQTYLEEGFKIEVNFGKSKIDTKLKSMIDVLNIFATEKWVLDRTYVNTYEKMNKSVHYWILRKDDIKLSDTEIQNISLKLK